MDRDSPLQEQVTKYSGMQAYLSDNVKNDLLDKYFPKLQEIIEKPIVMKQHFNSKGFHAKNFLILINLTRENIIIRFDESKNAIVCAIKNQSIRIFFHWLVSNWIFETKGNIEMKGVIDNFELDVGLDCKKSDLGYETNFTVVNGELDINADSLKISIDNSFFEIFEPLINSNVFGFTTWVVSKVKQFAFQDILIPEITRFVNAEIKMSTKKRFELKQYNVCLSTSLIKDMKVFSKYLMLPLEGLVFSQKTGYKKTKFKINSEKEIPKNKIEKLVQNNALVMVIQEDCLMSMLNSLIENKFSHSMNLKDPVLRIKLEFIDWDEQSVVCKKDYIETKIAMTVNTNLLGMGVSFKVYMICQINLNPKGDLKNQNVNTDALNKSDQIAQLKDSKQLAAWDIKLTIKEIDNVAYDFALIKNQMCQDTEMFNKNNEDPVKKFQEDILLGQEINEVVAFPEVLLFGDSKMQKVDLEIIDGFLLLKIQIKI